MTSEKQNDKEGERYKQLGFLCGLEIHQRLATGEKLFCACDTRIVDSGEEPVSTVTRRQRAVAGELGEVDRSAAFEEKRGRSFTYNIFDRNTCLVDIDEEPPHEMNREALASALAVASSMDMCMIDELQPMRKEVVDGSDPSAFQRTTLIGVNGHISVEGHTIAIPAMSLEEESGGIESSTQEDVVYDTDRLGIPLIEIDTDANIPSPRIAKAVAQHIGMLLRVHGGVQRGIGSIRQDVNVSIKGGARTEMKGVQELDVLDKFIENEILRQQNLLKAKAMLSKAKASVGNARDVTTLFKGTDIAIIKRQLDKKGAVFAVALKGFKGIVGMELNPNLRLGTEISDYAKKAGVRGLIHSDESMDKYGFSEHELAALAKVLGLRENDAFALIAGRSVDEAHSAAELAIQRAKIALDGVPKETRMAYDSTLCTTRFMRPLPGSHRMYPETDAKLIEISRDMLDIARANAPNVEKMRKSLLAELKNETLAARMLSSPRLQLYRNVIAHTKADPQLVANVLLQKLTELRREGLDVDSIREERLAEMFDTYEKRVITKQAIGEILKALSAKDDGIDAIVKKLELERISKKELETLVKNELAKHGGKGEKEVRSAIMAKYRLTVDGSELNELLSKQKAAR